MLAEGLQLAAQYSNAVLIAILPHVSDFSQRLNLPLYPVTTHHVQKFSPYPERTDPGGWLVLTNGYEFWFQHGSVWGFRTPRSYYSLQDPDQIPEFYGKLNVSRDEAIELARSAIRKLGYTEEQLYADLEPEVKPPPQVENRVVPHFLIEWPAVNRDVPSTRIEIDAANKLVCQLWLLSRHAWKAPLQVDEAILPEDPEAEFEQFRVRGEKAEKHLLVAFESISNMVARLPLPFPMPLTTN